MKGRLIMKKFIKGLFKCIIFLLIVLCIGWFGLKYYFTYVNRIGDTVRSDVNAYVQTHHSQFIKYGDIPEMYRNAVIATEDRSFFTNTGVDLKGTIRAIYMDITSGQFIQGGSTITQQLVHNTILNSTSKSVRWKLLESIYAIGLYDTMSKQEVFELYTNIIYFGHGANGLYQASQIYFGKAPSKLSSGELTMLAGLPNAPSVYDPYKNTKLARERQQHVIQSMVDDSAINESQGDQILSEAIKLK